MRLEEKGRNNGARARMSNGPYTGDADIPLKLKLNLVGGSAAFRAEGVSTRASRG